MRHTLGLPSLVLRAALAGLSIQLGLINMSRAQAESRRPAPGACTCPNNQERDQPAPTPRPRFADAEDSVAIDRLDALEAMHTALTEAGDGASYVWHGVGGRVSGIVTPVASFKDGYGRICRHVVVTLSRSGLSRRTEGIACRLPGGVWQLDG
jgi:hypothetical protein